MRLLRIISGGQTGADRGGLIAAKAAGIPTGGWMPRGFRAQDGMHPEFAELYGMREHTSWRYPPRTVLNVIESDATLCFATRWDSAGEVLTQVLCERNRKPRLAISPGDDTTPAAVLAWLIEHGVDVLNVAGNTERDSPGMERFVVGFLQAIFNECRVRV